MFKPIMECPRPSKVPLKLVVLLFPMGEKPLLLFHADVPLASISVPST